MMQNYGSFWEDISMKNIGFENIRITGGFWAKRQELMRRVTAKSVYDRFDETGRMEAFRCEWKEGMDKRPHFFWDSDVAKWIESVAYLTRLSPVPELEELADRIIDDLVANQWEDGYFNIYYTVVEPGQRFTVRDRHELYCAGHLLEAAIAYYEATGKDKFYRAMLRYVDLIERVFIKEQSAAFLTPGHEEIELALIKLYDFTGEGRYLDMVKFFVDMRGNNGKDSRIGSKGTLPWEYAQDQLPIREQSTAEGHAVRLCYLYCGVADLAARTGDEALREACVRVFRNIVERRMYITGGIGSISEGERFEEDFILPNEVAYAETCAALSLALFAQRMQVMFDDSVYADTVERVIYNGLLSGMSLDGKAFFYENPLRITLAQRKRPYGNRFNIRFPITERVEVFNCSCCPPNITRFIPSIGNMMYTAGEGVVRVNQFMESEATFDGMTLAQKTDYPFDGKVSIAVSGGKTTLGIRVPSWCREYTLAKNGKKIEADLRRGYAYFDVADGDVVDYEMKMTPTVMSADPRVSDNAGRVALMRGPVVYCAEGVDNKAFVARTGTLDDIILSPDMHFDVVYDDKLDAPAIVARALCHTPADTLYAPEPRPTEQADVRFIPYYAFANRGETDMLVWVLKK